MLQVVLVMALMQGISCCYSSGYYSRARARAAKLTYYDNGSAIPLELLEANDADYCSRMEYEPFTAAELRSSASVFNFPDDAQLSVPEGGRLTCSFDDPQEFCAWYNVPSGPIRFWKANYESDFDNKRFNCTSIRQFQFRETFLIGGGEPTMGMQKIALETQVPCQYEEATLKFDIWSNSEDPIARICIIKIQEQKQMDVVDEMECKEFLPQLNPLTATIPQSADPFRLRLEILNVGTNSLVLIDNIYYEGRICELVPEEEISTTIVPETTSFLNLAETNQPLPSDSSISDQIQLLSDELEKKGSDEAPKFEHSEKRARALSARPTVFNGDTSEEVISTLNPVEEVNVCDALTCDFNTEDPCFYSLNGIGSTSLWKISKTLIGNRHTGIQRINLNDPSECFLYAGEDRNLPSDEIFVLESPNFSISQNIYLLFDIYLRSHGPILKVCLDSFDYCPYVSPPVEKEKFWHKNERIFVPPGTRKVYFLAEKLRANLFVALDHIRVEAEDGSELC